mgnify:CR=1 FL=1
MRSWYMPMGAGCAIILTLISNAAASAGPLKERIRELSLRFKYCRLLVYADGRGMRNHSLQEYFEPQNFAGMELVQVVTLTFTK